MSTIYFFRVRPSLPVKNSGCMHGFCKVKWLSCLGCPQLKQFLKTTLEMTWCNLVKWYSGGPEAFAT